MSKTAFYAEIRIGQNIMPISTGYNTLYVSGFGNQVSNPTVMRPLEFSVNFGICW
jgi:hypothetical protein